MTAYARAFLCSLLATSMASACPMMASGQQEKAGDVTKSQTAQADTPSTEEKEVTRIASLVIEALNQKNIKEAISLMTDKGFEDYCGQQFMFVLQLSHMGTQEGEEHDTAEESLKGLFEVSKKYGFDKVDWSSLESFELTVQNLQGEALSKALLEAQEKMEALALSAVPKEKRLEALLEIIAAGEGVLVQPEDFVLTEVKISGKQCDVLVGSELSKGFAEAAASEEVDASEQAEESQDATPAMRLRFVQTEKGWMFDGFDKEKMIADLLALQEAATNIRLIDDFDVEGESIDGTQIDLKKHRGKVVLVDFWGTWCGPCRQALPELQSLYGEFHEQGFAIIGVAGDSSDALRKFLTDTKLPWDNIVDEEMKLAAKFGIKAYPTTLLIDQSGKHVASNLQPAALKLAIKTLLMGKSLESLDQD